MSIQEEIENNVYQIDIAALIARLERELSIKKDIIPPSEEGGETIEAYKQEAVEQLYYALYDTMLIILNTTHQRKIAKPMYSIWVRMIKDYWYLNKYDSKYSSSESEDDDINSSLNKVKSIQIGDTTTNFRDTTSQININGTTYNTGTIEYSDDILYEKYKKELYKHRKLRW